MNDKVKKQSKKEISEEVKKTIDALNSNNWRSNESVESAVERLKNSTELVRTPFLNRGKHAAWQESTVQSLITAKNHYIERQKKQETLPESIPSVLAPLNAGEQVGSISEVLADYRSELKDIMTLGEQGRDRFEALARKFIKYRRHVNMSPEQSGNEQFVDFDTELNQANEDWMKAVGAADNYLELPSQEELRALAGAPVDTRESSSSEYGEIILPPGATGGKTVAPPEDKDQASVTTSQPPRQAAKSEPYGSIPTSDANRAPAAPTEYGNADMLKGGHPAQSSSLESDMVGGEDTLASLIDEIDELLDITDAVEKSVGTKTALEQQASPVSTKTRTAEVDQSASPLIVDQALIAGLKKVRRGVNPTDEQRDDLSSVSRDSSSSDTDDWHSDSVPPSSDVAFDDLAGGTDYSTMVYLGEIKNAADAPAKEADDKAASSSAGQYASLPMNPDGTPAPSIPDDQRPADKGVNKGVYVDASAAAQPKESPQVAKTNYVAMARPEGDERGSETDTAPPASTDSRESGSTDSRSVGSEYAAVHLGGSGTQYGNVRVSTVTDTLSESDASVPVSGLAEPSVHTVSAQPSQRPIAAATGAPVLPPPFIPAQHLQMSIGNIPAATKSQLPPSPQGGSQSPLVMSISSLSPNEMMQKTPRMAAPPAPLAPLPYNAWDAEASMSDDDSDVYDESESFDDAEMGHSSPAAVSPAVAGMVSYKLPDKVSKADLSGIASEFKRLQQAVESSSEAGLYQENRDALADFHKRVSNRKNHGAVKRRARSSIKSLLKNEGPSNYPKTYAGYQKKVARGELKAWMKGVKRKDRPQKLQEFFKNYRSKHISQAEFEANGTHLQSGPMQAKFTIIEPGVLDAVQGMVEREVSPNTPLILYTPGEIETAYKELEDMRAEIDSSPVDSSARRSAQRRYEEKREEIEERYKVTRSSDAVYKGGVSPERDRQKLISAGKRYKEIKADGDPAAIQVARTELTNLTSEMLGKYEGSSHAMDLNHQCLENDKLVRDEHVLRYSKLFDGADQMQVRTPDKVIEASQRLLSFQDDMMAKYPHTEVADEVERICFAQHKTVIKDLHAMAKKLRGSDKANLIAHLNTCRMDMISKYGIGTHSHDATKLHTETRLTSSRAPRSQGSAKTSSKMYEFQELWAKESKKYVQTVVFNGAKENRNWNFKDKKGKKTPRPAEYNINTHINEAYKELMKSFVSEQGDGEYAILENKIGVRAVLYRTDGEPVDSAVWKSYHDEHIQSHLNKSFEGTPFKANFGKKLKRAAKKVDASSEAASRASIGSVPAAPNAADALAAAQLARRAEFERMQEQDFSEMNSTQKEKTVAFMIDAFSDGAPDDDVDLAEDFLDTLSLSGSLAFRVSLIEADAPQTLLEEVSALHDYSDMSDLEREILLETLMNNRDENASALDAAFIDAQSEAGREAFVDDLMNFDLYEDVGAPGIFEEMIHERLEQWSKDESNHAKISEYLEKQSNDFVFHLRVGLDGTTSKVLDIYDKYRDAQGLMDARFGSDDESVLDGISVTPAAAAEGDSPTGSEVGQDGARNDLRVSTSSASSFFDDLSSKSLTLEGYEDELNEKLKDALEELDELFTEGKGINVPDIKALTKLKNDFHSELDKLNEEYKDVIEGDPSQKAASKAALDSTQAKFTAELAERQKPMLAKNGITAAALAKGMSALSNGDGNKQKKAGQPTSSMTASDSDDDEHEDDSSYSI